MECDGSSHLETASTVIPQVLGAVGLQSAPPLSAAFTTGRTPSPADDYDVDEEEDIDEEALLKPQDNAAGTLEFQVIDEVGGSEDEEDPTPDPKP